MRLCLTTGSEMYKHLPCYKDRKDVEPAFEIAVLLTKLKARTAVLSRRTMVDAQLDASSAIELDNAFVEARAAKFAATSKISEVLQARFDEVGKKLAADLAAASKTADPGAHHVPVALDMEEVEPGLDEGDEVEQDLDELDEIANPGGSQDSDEVNEAPVVASAVDMPGFSQNARTAYVDGKNDPIALACEVVVTDDTFLEKFFQLAADKIRLVRNLVSIDGGDMRAKKTCDLCVLEDEDNKDKLWAARDLYAHQVERMYHTPAMRFECYLDKTPIASHVTELKEGQTRSCPFCDRGTYAGYDRFVRLIDHIGKTHMQDVPEAHQLYLRHRVFKYFPTYAERKAAGWTRDRFKSAGGERGQQPFLPREDAIDRIVADENEKARDATQLVWPDEDDSIWGDVPEETV